MLVDRAIKLSHSQFHNENLNLVKTILKRNHYPDSFIEIYFNKRLNIIKNINNSRRKWSDSLSLVFSYMKNFYYPIKNILKPYSINVISSKY